MARICLVYLLEPKLTGRPLDEKKLSEFPFAHHAAMHWHGHFKDGFEME
jgi:hypothetical protein